MVTKKPSFFSLVWPKFKESLASVLPISVVILLLISFLTPLPFWTIFAFLICMVLLILGIVSFSQGADMSMQPLGQNFGETMSKSRKLWVFIVFSIILGIVITVSEPDLMVLASQISAVNSWLFIAIAGIGVGVFLAIGILRIVFQFNLKFILAGCYLVVIILSLFVSPKLLPLCFDSGSVTTGTMSVPFILAFGFGISAVRGTSKSEQDSFGLIALSSIGPVISVMIMCLFVKGGSIGAGEGLASAYTTASDVGTSFGYATLENLKNISIVLLPIIAMFFIVCRINKDYNKKRILKFLTGVAFTFVGLLLFLTGVEVGYLPVASQIGQLLTAKYDFWVSAIIVFVCGVLMILAEPVVPLLIHKIKTATKGLVSGKVMLIALCLGVGVACLIGVLRIAYNINFLLLVIPLYAVAVLMMFFTPNIFTSLAFDCGGVTTGAMATSFMLPMLNGISEARGSSTEAFGTVALIAILPVICVFFIGLLYKISTYKNSHDRKQRVLNKQVNIIEYSWRRNNNDNDKK